MSCKRSYVWQSNKSIEERRFNWFKLWITEAYSVRKLALIKRKSKATVKRVIKYWLKQSPEEISNDYSKAKYLILDGTFLQRPKGICAVMDCETHKLIDAAIDIREGGRELFNFYSKLSKAGLKVVSATTDGNPQQMKYLKMVWPDIILQRCIVHVQRQGLSWCRRNPKRSDAKNLRELFLELTEVKTKKQSLRFIEAVNAWESRYGSAIESSLNRGRVFSDIIRARSMLIKALPNLFHYIDNPKIARSTNALEGYFSRLKEHYRLHRGLSKMNKYNYFKWYFFLKPK